MRKKTKATEVVATPEKTRRSTRGRGRAKSPTPSPTREHDDDESAQETQQQQQPPEETTEIEQTEEEAAAPKRRGRRSARTPSIDAAVAGSTSAVSTPKRGRGRKKAEPEPVIEEEPVEQVKEGEAKEAQEESPVIELHAEPEPAVELAVVETEQEEEREVIKESPAKDKEPELKPAQKEQEKMEEIAEEVEDDEPIEIHVQMDENPITPQTEESSRDVEETAAATEPDQESPDKKNPPSDAEEGEVVDDSSEEKAKSEDSEEERRRLRPARKMRRITETLRVSSEHKTKQNEVDKQINAKSDDADSHLAAAVDAVIPNDELNKENAPRTRKRKWLTQKSVDTKPAIISISTDSLKNIIKDPVKPVPLADIKLDLTPERQKTEEEEDDDDENAASSPESGEEESRKRAPAKVSITEKESLKESNAVNAEQTKADKAMPKPLVNSKNKISNILYITNLVRPFTVLQLKGLLARTGKIVENGFWIDKIKSKCYVKYENEE